MADVVALPATFVTVIMLVVYGYSWVVASGQNGSHENCSRNVKVGGMILSPLPTRCRLVSTASTIVPAVQGRGMGAALFNVIVHSSLTMFAHY